MAVAFTNTVAAASTFQSKSTRSLFMSKMGAQQHNTQMMRTIYEKGITPKNHFLSKTLLKNYSNVNYV